MRHLSYPFLSETKAPEGIPRIIARYRQYLIEVRGVAKPEQQLADVCSFLGKLNVPLKDASKREIDRFIVEQGQYCKKRTVASLSSFLRAFLRFLAGEGPGGLPARSSHRQTSAGIS